MTGGEGDEGEDGGGAEPAPGHQGVHHQAEGCRAHSPPGITTCTLTVLHSAWRAKQVKIMKKSAQIN